MTTTAGVLTHDVAVVANVSLPHGQWTSARQVPTFVLPVSVHGLTSLAHAAHVAADVLTTTYAPNGTRVVLALSTPDETHVAAFVVTDGHPVLTA